MQMSGEQRIAAPRQRVWAALNDPEVLKRCIPGCQSLEKESDERLRAVVEVKIGPIGARFNGVVTLSDLDAPNGYTITGEGQGGTAGFAKGGAKVRLADDNGGTLLSYDVDAQVGGRLAQLGGPMIDATAKQLAGKFFQQLGEVLAPGAATSTSTGATASRAASGAAASGASGGIPIVWLLAVLSGALIGYLIGRGQGGSSDWMGLAIGLLLVVVAAGAFHMGRRLGAPIVHLDQALLARLGAENRK